MLEDVGADCRVSVALRGLLYFKFSKGPGVDADDQKPSSRRRNVVCHRARCHGMKRSDKTMFSGVA